ncbi:MAG TPA: hypothetical protein VGX68_00545 [Thermoanaerobaculia bacterium]|nr:hypothetical protein [Thermoanaerobaculia bacterium]
MRQRVCASALTFNLMVYGIWTLLLAGGCKPRSEEPERNPHFKDGGYSAVLDKLGVPHQTLRSDMKPVDLAAWPKDGAVNGPAPTRLTGATAGLPLAAMPGVRRISLDEVKRMDVIEQSTGLFVVDLDFLPRELPEILKSKELTLRESGELVDRNGQPAVAFVTSEVYQMRMSSQEPRQSWLPNLLQGLADGLVPAAEAANPFPFRCFSFTPWAVYHGGFHRWYEADTWVAAFGPDGGGGCSNASPHTRIDFLRAGAAVRGAGSSPFCFNCETMHAHDVWDVGYWWPAHGTPVTTHFGIWADGSFSMSRTAQMSW